MDNNGVYNIPSTKYFENRKQIEMILPRYDTYTTYPFSNYEYCISLVVWAYSRFTSRRGDRNHHEYQPTFITTAPWLFESFSGRYILIECWGFISFRGTRKQD
jgi:hypothetical protein